MDPRSILNWKGSIVTLPCPAPGGWSIGPVRNRGSGTSPAAPSQRSRLPSESVRVPRSLQGPLFSLDSVIVRD